MIFDLRFLTEIKTSTNILFNEVKWPFVVFVRETRKKHHVPNVNCFVEKPISTHSVDAWIGSYTLRQGNWILATSVQFELANIWMVEIVKQILSLGHNSHGHIFGKMLHLSISKKGRYNCWSVNIALAHIPLFQNVCDKIWNFKFKQILLLTNNWTIERLGFWLFIIYRAVFSIKFIISMNTK